MVLVLWRTLVVREADELETQTVFAAHEERRIIYREVDATASSFRRATTWAHSNLGVDEQRRDLSALVRDVPGLAAAVRLTDSSRASMIEPHDFDVAPLVDAWRQRLQGTGHPDTLSYLPLDSRGVYFAIVSPICVALTCNGAIAGVVDARALFSEILAGAQRDFLFVVVRDGKVVGSDSLALPPSPWHKSVDLRLGGAQWELVALPTAATLKRLHTSLPLAVLIMGLIVSALLPLSLLSGRAAWASARATERARAADAAVQELESLAVMGRVAARVAHEINNPLAGIQYSFLLIKDAIPVEHPHFAYVGAIEREIARIAAVTRQLYETYRPEPEASANTSLTTVVGDAVAFMRQVNREANVQIVVDLSGAPSVVPVSSAILRQVVYNLVQNALDVSPPGGTVTVTAAVAANALEFSVADEGPGVPPELQERIFEQFFTTKESRMKTSGMGLGLSMVKRSVEFAGGHIRVDRSAAGGALFTVTLPIGDGEALA
jgi:signal transduction histidine kinase